MSKVSQLEKVLAQLESERQILDLAIAKIKNQMAVAPKRAKKPRAATLAEAVRHSEKVS